GRREVPAERLDPEALRRVVTGRDEVDPELLGGRVVRLLRLAREESVEALVVVADQVVARCTGRDRETLDPRWPEREDDRLARNRLAHPRRPLLDRDTREPPGDAAPP